jgi:hypothetical protein
MKNALTLHRAGYKKYHAAHTFFKLSKVLLLVKSLLNVASECAIFEFNHLDFFVKYFV